MPPMPLHHIVRVRTATDLEFMRPGLMDEVLVNANLLENSPETTAAALRETTLPFSIDPVLTRFQMPAWWRNDKGETKRNYARLGALYVRGTSIDIPSGPLLETVATDEEWRRLASNVIAYQKGRLSELHPQLELFRAQLRPTRLLAPALVAFSSAEDRVNRLLGEGSAEVAECRVAIPVVITPDRLRDRNEISKIVASIPTESASSLFLWTPSITEDLLLSDRSLFQSLLWAIESMADRGVPVGHMHATYLIAALHDIGISAVVHHMGWIDKGEPAEQPRGGPRSCQTYVPGIRHVARFSRAYDLGRALDADAFGDRFCNCGFCVGAFAAGQHPLDLLLEEHTIRDKNGRERQTPTSRAVGLNTWHYLSARQQEVEAFAASPASEVVARDIARAAALADGTEGDRLRRVAAGL